MIVKLLTEHHLEFLSLQGGCRGVYTCQNITLLEITHYGSLLFVIIISDPEKKKLPIEGPWRHFSLKVFIKNFQEGKVETGGYTIQGNNFCQCFTP